jgi:hypothetical protein
MWRKVSKIALVFTSLALFVALPSFAKEKARIVKESPKAVELREALRDLWVGHIFWVRNVALTTKLGDVEAAKVAEENAVKNAHALADAIIPYYGQAAANKLFGLLAGHYGAIKEYMTAAYAGNKEGADVAFDKLKKNAGEIATFLSSANPNWPRETLLSALLAHGGHHVAQIEDFRDKNYVSEAQIWDAMIKHIYMIADTLGKGIVKQFPKKF